MSDFLRDNLALPTDKVDSAGGSSPVAVEPTRKWSPNDANRVLQALRSIQTYLRTGTLDLVSTTTVVSMSVVNDASAAVNPALEFVGYDGRWLMAMDTANAPTSRDFVPVCVKLNYSFSDGATTSGSPTLTSASRGGFAPIMIGAGLSGAGIPNGATVLAVGGPTSLTMSANATATATGVRVHVTSGLTLDLEYWRHRGALSPTLGIGVTPPDGSARLQVSAADDEPAMGTARLRRGPSQVGNVLSLHDSSPADRFWVDKDFYLSGSNGGGIGGAIAIAADTTNQRALLLTGSDKVSVYGFSLPTGAGGLCRFSCVSTGDVAFDVLTDGSFKHQGAKLGLYGVAPVTRQTVVALTDNTTGAADSTLQAIPNPTDSPATADALRDDIVANVLPAIRNDLADLAAKVNEIRAALVTLGALQ